MRGVVDGSFWKMTGSGNDFVFFDARSGGTGELEEAETIGALCDRRRGVGADGIVLFESDAEHTYGIRYFNRDGSLAEFCGNASLCSVRLALELEVIQPGQRFTFRTSSGAIEGQFGPNGAEVSMPEVRDLNASFPAELDRGESRIGFARVGVPHLVVACSNVDDVDVGARGRSLRNHPTLAAGANVNFVAKRGSDWTYRTYERGVEEETLACGSGSVAAAAMLKKWNDESGPITMITRSGAPLTVTFRDDRSFLAGEGRLVFQGRLRDVIPPI